jgi:hypothetical protein
MSDNLVLPNSPNVYGPITPSQMFERTFALLRENAKLFFGIVLVVIGVEIVVGGVLGGNGLWMARTAIGTAPITRALFSVPLLLLGAALIYIFTQIIHGALFIATEAKLASAPITVGEACRLAADKAGRLVGISILVALRIFGYMLLFYFVLAIVGLMGALMFGGFNHLADRVRFHSGQMQFFGVGALLGIFLLALLVLYIAALFWLVIRYAVAIPAALAEDLRVTDAIRRSIHLSRGSKGRLLALFLVVACIWIAFVAVTLPVQLMAAHHGLMHSTATLGTPGVLNFGVAAIRIFLSWIVIAFTGVATALCYYDLRVRKEGFGATVATPALDFYPTPPSSTPDWPIEDLPVS